MSAVRTFRSTQFGTPGINPQSLGIPAAAFPGRVATNADLIVAVDRQQTSLLLPMAATDTTMTVLNPAGIVAYNLLSIDNEIVKTTGTPAGNVVPVSRGFDGTSPATHSAGALVSGFIDAYHHNALVAEVEAIETTLGPNLSQIGISGNRFFNAANFNFAPQTPGGGLTGGISNTVTLTPVPLGVNGTNSNYYVKITGSGGSPSELVKVTGGTAVSGAASGTLTFTPVRSYLPGWTISSESCGIREAIGYGAICIFFPAGCKWVPADNLIPGGIYLRGESWGSIAGGGSMIEAVNPATQDVSVGPSSQIYNVNVHGQWATGIDPVGVDKWCPIQSFINSDDVNPWLINSWPYATYYGAAASGQGSQRGGDRTQNIATTRGGGSAWYGGTTQGANGGCFDAENQGTGAINYRALMGGVNTYGFAARDTGNDPGTGACFVADCSLRTGGELLVLNHQGPAFHGTVISSNMDYNTGGVSGFNGLFWQFVVAGTQISTMSANGNVTFGVVYPWINFSDFGTAGNTTIADYQMTGIVQHEPNVPTTDQTDTAANIVSYIQNSRQGSSFDFFLRNAGSAVLTLTGGTGVTILGTATVASGQQRWFKVFVQQVSPPTVNLFSMGASTF